MNLHSYTMSIIMEVAEMSAIPVSVGQEEVALFYIMATQMLQMIRLSSKYRNDLFSLAMLSITEKISFLEFNIYLSVPNISVFVTYT